MSEMNSRRQFMKLVCGVSGIALIAPNIVFGAEERRRGGATAPAAGGAAGGAGGSNVALVKPGEGMAATLHYVEKNSDVKDASLKTERQGVPFAKQVCSGCMFYTADGKHGGAEVGKCTIFNGMHVKASGWCSSWSKKA